MGPLRFRYTIGNQLASRPPNWSRRNLAKIGIEMKIEPTDKLGNTLEHQRLRPHRLRLGGHAVPVGQEGPVHDRWRRQLRPLVEQGGRRPIEQAVTTFDDDQAREQFNQMDELMVKDAYNLPLFQKPVFLAVYSDFVNVRNNPTSAGPAYNIEEWGLKE